jgi:predicted dehydrogenase
MSFETNGDRLDNFAIPREPEALGIGFIGSGGILDRAHIPSYKTAGYKLVAVTSRTYENAEKLAKTHGIPNTYKSIDALLEDQEVKVIDIALPPEYQTEAVLKAIKAGKHVLAQKPFALSYAEAEKMVVAAKEAGVSIAVNQNGRFDPSINAARTLIQQGFLGERHTFELSMHFNMEWQSYFQSNNSEQLMMLHMSIHHMDQIRWLFGDPVKIQAMSRSVNNYPWPGEAIAQYTMQFDDGFIATCLDEGVTLGEDFGINYRIQGSDGVLKGEIGWPRVKKSTLSLRHYSDGEEIYPNFSRQWFPDAFGATMGELLAAIEDGREPSNSGLDNLETMRLVLAAYKSIEEDRAVRPNEIS